jgi:hypothetical protein
MVVTSSDLSDEALLTRPSYRGMWRSRKLRFQIASQAVEKPMELPGTDFSGEAAIQDSLGRRLCASDHINH